MNDSSNSSIRITDHNPTGGHEDERKLKEKFRMIQLKKPLIFFLMAVVCAGCLYLIFKPGKNKVKEDEKGFNAVIPQASDDNLQSDKQKAYEQQLLEQKDEEKRNNLTSLSDYWDKENMQNDNGVITDDAAHGSHNNSIQSYKAAQQTLGSFYGRDNQEVNHLQREVSRLRNELLQKDMPSQQSTVNDQLQLMEKSYQMAAKYLPSGKQEKEVTIDQPVPDQEKIKLTYAGPAQAKVISRIYREPSDSAWINGFEKNRFVTIEDQNQAHLFQTNAVLAAVAEMRVVRPDEQIGLRLLQPMMLGKLSIPKGTVVKASAKFQDGRLQLKISSIEYKGIIEPVEINVYDNDGQLGLFVPYSPEQSALTDIVANMGQTSGTSVMLTRSAGQQVTADLSRGVLQGVSGYFQKKVRSPKVTIKVGHQVYLVSKK